MAPRLDIAARKSKPAAPPAMSVELRARTRLPKLALQQVIIPAPTIAHATFNRGAVSKCGLFSTLTGWTDERARRFPFQHFTVPASKAVGVAAMVAHFYEEIGLKRPAVRLSPKFTKKKPWGPPRDLGRKPLRKIEGLLRPPRGTLMH
ncbi:hypothetical protein AAFN86_26985 [Roseomonas sp. CAU 1739]|uniref:hypothetical protein n=1 Tax=Roseomonas sp. CAU 1739 TaxID=3140364 RepID=UPI00325B30BF